MDLFPTNGLDRSILAPVLVGLAFLTFFAETLGWPFVGLVVPGYLAAVLASAPVTAGAMLAESFLTYFLARAIGQWLPRLGIWTPFFGRERFFLLIAASILVRLLAEGWALPTLAQHMRFRHASELYSVGLALVPLIANSFWNVGFRRGVFFSAVATAATYLVLTQLLLPFTNLSLSRFELTYESVALDFLQAGKAYLLLMAGALLGARANVQYGWDFNGILVPGLLAIAWYSPLKLVATVTEGMLVAFAAQQLIRLPLLSRQLIEGPRRTLLVFVVGFAVKWLIGVTGMYLHPGERMTDFYGFGYVLPTLVALKIWQYQNAGRVVMPTLQVSLTAFALGNVLGYLLHLTLPDATASATRAPPPAAQTGSAALQLTLQSAWPRRSSAGLPSDDTMEAIAAIARQLRGAGGGAARGVDTQAEGDASPTLARVQQRAAAFGVSLLRLRAGSGPPAQAGAAAWWMLATPDQGHRNLRYLPTIALRARAGDGLLVARGPPSSPTAAAAWQLATALHADAVLVCPTRFGQDRVDAWAQALTDALGTRRLASLEVSAPTAGGGAALRPSSRRAPAIARLRRTLGVDASGDPTAPMALSDDQLDALAARAFDATTPIARWKGPLWKALRNQIPAPPPAERDADGLLSRRRLRLFGAVLAPSMWRWQSGRAPSRFARALGDSLGFRLARADDGATQTLVLYGAEAERRQAWLVWAARRPARQAGVADRGPPPDPQRVVATPELGRSGIPEATQLAASLGGAGHLLLGDLTGLRRPGELRNAPRYRRAYLQRALELLLDQDAHVLQLRRMPRSAAALDLDVAWTSGVVVTQGLGVPAWTARWNDVLVQAGLRTGWYDGSPARYPLRGLVDPLVAYARRFAPDRAVLGWLHTRPALALADALPARWQRALRALGLAPVPGDVADALSMPPHSRAKRSCDLQALLAHHDAYRTRRNPHALAALGKALPACHGKLIEDTATGVAYLVAHARRASLAQRLGRPAAEPAAKPAATSGALRTAILARRDTLWVERSRERPRGGAAQAAPTSRSELGDHSADGASAEEAP